MPSFKPNDVDAITISSSSLSLVLSYYSSLSSNSSPNTLGERLGHHIVESTLRDIGPSSFAMPKATDNDIAKSELIRDHGTESSVPCSQCVRNYRVDSTVECKRHIDANKRRKCGRCFSQGGVLCLQVSSHCRSVRQS